MGFDDFILVPDYCLSLYFDVNCIDLGTYVFGRHAWLLIQSRLTALLTSFRVVLGWAYRGLTGGFLLLQNFNVAISVSPYVCFILVLILISVFLR